MKQITTSYIIINWNGLSLLRQIIQSLQMQMSRSDVEVIVVDNGSTDCSPDFLQSHPQIHSIFLSENRGVSVARNIGLKAAVGRYLFILDNDIVANDEALLEMEHFMETHPQVGLCACRLVDGEGCEQESCKKYPGLIEKSRNLLFRGRFHFAYEKQMRGNVAFEPEYVIGACQMIRREAFEQVGLLDEHIFYGPEDCDFCLRIRQKGWHIMYLPYVSIQHLCQRRTNAHPFSSLGLRHLKGLFYFYQKYKRVWL